MRRPLAIAVAVAALGLAACGGDDETTTTSGATGATGAQGIAADGDLTADEFIDASIPDQLDAVEQAVEDNPDCAQADTAPGSDFQVSVAIDAASADPDTPLGEIVADNC